MQPKPRVFSRHSCCRCTVLIGMRCHIVALFPDFRTPLQTRITRKGSVKQGGGSTLTSGYSCTINFDHKTLTRPTTGMGEGMWIHLIVFCPAAS